MPKPWIIFGANGYTGELIAREAVRRGLKPMLAGRTAAKMQPLAASLGLRARVFDLRDAAATARNVEGMALVLHCAGPFSATAAQMMGVLHHASTSRRPERGLSGPVAIVRGYHDGHARDAPAQFASCAGRINRPAFGRSLFILFHGNGRG
jgi:short subunit dehydrogenase-like uncharacterized protein